MALIDLLLCGVVEAGTTNAPPDAPVIGAFYRIASGPATGAFAGHEGQLAGWTAAGWRFVSPVDGIRLLERGSGLTATFMDGQWSTGIARASQVAINGQQVVGPRAAAIANPDGGATVDSAARASILAILNALRAHGLIAP